MLRSEFPQVGEYFTHRHQGIRRGDWHTGRQEPEWGLEGIIGKGGSARDAVWRALNNGAQSYASVPSSAALLQLA